MNEAEAQSWLRDELNVSRETMERLDGFRQMVIAENSRQNLISAASIDHFWARHIVDSAQLVRLAPETWDNWLDLGTGAGFPGIVAAILFDAPFTLVESRRKRIDFLAESAEKLGLRQISIQGSRLEMMRPASFSIISARAFAPLLKIFELAHSFSTEKTCWLLPKGRSAREELESVRASWHGEFHVKQSVTDPESAIIVAQAVKRKGKR